MRSRDEAEELYLQNERLVYGFLKQRYPDSLHDDDAQQWCRIGLWTACLEYSEDQNCAFSTYAYLCMRSQIINNYYRPMMLKRNGGTGFMTKCPEEYMMTVSLDQPVKNKRGDERGSNFYNFIYRNKDKDIDWFDFNEILSKLKEMDKTILKMRLAGYSTYEIGRVFDKTAMAIKYRIDRKIKPVIEAQLCLPKGYVHG